MASPYIMLLQETNIDKDSLLSLRKKSWNKHAGLAMSDFGSVGGIATLWIANLFSLSNSHTTQHWIFSELRHIPSMLSISLFNLYVLVNFQEKHDCWTSLNDFIASNSISNVMIAGDLNIMLDSKERKGGICGRDPMLNTVEKLITCWDLIDFKPKKGIYTWTNN